MDPQSDKRKYERFRLRVPLYISVQGRLFHKKIGLESKDVSAGGVSFETGRDLPLEAETRLVVQLGDMKPTFIRGRVAHLSLDPASARYTVGVEFEEFVNSTRDELVARFDEWQRAGAAPAQS